VFAAASFVFLVEEIHVQCRCVQIALGVVAHTTVDNGPDVVLYEKIFDVAVKRVKMERVAFVSVCCLALALLSMGVTSFDLRFDFADFIVRDARSVCRHGCARVCIYDNINRRCTNAMSEEAQKTICRPGGIVLVDGIDIGRRMYGCVRNERLCDVRVRDNLSMCNVACRHHTSVWKQYKTKFDVFMRCSGMIRHPNNVLFEEVD
jgi:hypothetical protein